MKIDKGKRFIRNSLFLGILFGGTLGFEGCTPASTLPFAEAFSLEEYFPFQEGKVYEFRVDSVQFYQEGLNIAVDTTSGVLKKQWKDRKDKGNGNFEIYLSHHYRNEKESFSEERVLYEVEEGRIFYTRENLRFLLMPLYFSSQRPWKGILFDAEQYTERIGQSSLFPFLGWESEIEAIGVSYSIQGRDFPDVLILVRAKWEDSLLEIRSVKEWYAKGIGLIASERWIIDSNCIECDPSDWPAKANVGYIVREELVVD